MLTAGSVLACVLHGYIGYCCHSRRDTVSLVLRSCICSTVGEAPGAHPRCCGYSTHNICHLFELRMLHHGHYYSYALIAFFSILNCLGSTTLFVVAKCMQHKTHRTFIIVQPASPLVLGVGAHLAATLMISLLQTLASTKIWLLYISYLSKSYAAFCL